MQLGKLNLVYGRNERGKTYLVEFIIRSLFRNPRLWPLRTQKGGGKVTVEGLTEAGLIKFSPSSAKKLEDFWDEANSGLPADFSKLLVVKGAEIELANVVGGADKAILKRFLSSKEILDKIEKRISKTIQESHLDNGTITGPKRGEINTRTSFLEQYRKINRLFDQLDKGYSGGHRQALSEERQRVKAQIDQQMKAKQHLAYMVDQEIKQLKEKKNQVAGDRIQDIKTKLNLYRQKVAEYKKKQEEQGAAEERSKHYEWLKHAHGLYQEALKQKVEEPKPIFIILAILFVAGAAGLIFFDLPIFAALSLIGVIVFGWLSIQKYRDLASQAKENQEIDNLKKEFRTHFGMVLTGLPRMSEMLANMEEDFNSAKLLKKQLSEELKSLYTLKTEISDLVSEIGNGEKIESKFWNEVLQEKEKEFQKLENKIREKELHLAKLGVDPSDYEPKKPSVEYSRLKLESLENTLANMESKIEQETQKLTSLKQIICEHTDDNISTSWEVLIVNLRKKRESILTSYRQKTAEVIGKLAVYNVLNNLRKAEDKKIVQGLRSKKVLEPLYEITNRYDGLSLDGENLVVNDAFNSFHLEELSSGAQEQVLLALRMGFSRMLLGQDKLFLILDDAFQYSDWQRRKLLVEKAVNLAQDGWQILYFTMDDNIRELFNDVGKRLGNDYKLVELENNSK